MVAARDGERPGGLPAGGGGEGAAGGGERGSRGGRGRGRGRGGEGGGGGGEGGGGGGARGGERRRRGGHGAGGERGGGGPGGAGGGGAGGEGGGGVGGARGEKAGRGGGVRKLARSVAAAIALSLAFTAVAGWENIGSRFADTESFQIRRKLLASTVAMIRETALAGLTGWARGVWSTRAYATFDNGLIANQAHNDWAEWMAEGGVGMVLLLLAVASCSAARAVAVPLGARCSCCIPA